MNDNLNTPADSKIVKLFNSDVNFCFTANEVTRDERENALDIIQQLVDQTKETLNEK